jgi:hypothetical protein
VVWKDRKFEYERWSESDHPMKGLADLHVGGDDE